MPTLPDQSVCLGELVTQGRAGIAGIAESENYPSCHLDCFWHGAMNDGAAQRRAQISQLLRFTNVNQWRSGLQKLLGSYLTSDAVIPAIDFLEDAILAALRALRNPTESPGFPAFCIPVDRKPPVLGLDPWKYVMLGLHFDITEPENNRHLDLLEVTVTGKVREDALHGFLSLLEILKGLDWYTFRTMISLERPSALVLLHAVERLRRSTNSAASDDSHMISLMERYPDFMRSLGFQKRKVSATVNHEQRPRSSRKYCAEWQDPGTELPLSVELVLLGLFQSPEDVQVFV